MIRTLAALLLLGTAFMKIAAADAAVLTEGKLRR